MLFKKKTCLTITCIETGIERERGNAKDMVRDGKTFMLNVDKLQKKKNFKSKTPDNARPKYNIKSRNHKNMTKDNIIFCRFGGKKIVNITICCA